MIVWGERLPEPRIDQRDIDSERDRWRERRREGPF